MPLHREPLPTYEFAIDGFTPEAGSTYIHGAMGEERADLSQRWVDSLRLQGTALVTIQHEERELFDATDPRGELVRVSLRSRREMSSFLGSLPGRLYLDITALSHPTWASVLSAAVRDQRAHSVVYTEPASYRRSDTPAQGIIYDLSERIEGIAPLPGFARFTGPASDEGNVVALLGFEGARLGYLVEKLQVSLNNLVPIVGVPGFAPGHPFESIAGNIETLGEQYVHSRLRLAKANCPFDAFHQIYRAFRDGAWDYGRVAPIGTKPHGVGAVLFALSRPESVELVYDHPVRAAKRSAGKARVCVYDTSEFCSSDLFLRRGEYSGF